MSSMLNCEDVRSWVWGASPADRERGDRMDVRMHIARCASCAQAEKEAQLLDDSLIAAVQDESIDPSRVQRRVLNRMRRGERTWWTSGLVLRAAAVVLVIVAAGAWISLRSSTPLETLARHHHREEVLGRDHRSWETDPNRIVRLLGTGINASPADASAVVTNGRVRAARLCDVGGTRQVHLLVERPQGPVSLFLCRETARRNILAADVLTPDGLRSAAVASDHLAVIVVGPISDDDATRLAKQMWSTLVI